jgi:hypothetical protein
VADALAANTRERAMRRTCAKGAFAVLTAIFVSGVAHAEDLTTKAPESMSSQPPITQAWPAPAHIFGDWDGLRTKLADLGITYSVTYMIAPSLPIRVSRTGRWRLGDTYPRAPHRRYLCDGGSLSVAAVSNSR